MQKVKNTSSERQAITNIPAFEAGEERVVEDNIAVILLWNTNFALCSDQESYDKTVKKAKSK